MLDEKKECANCGEVFKLSTHNQRFCGSSCREADKNKKINDRWAKREPRKPLPPGTLDKLFRKDFGKTYNGAIKRGKVFRG